MATDVVMPRLSDSMEEGTIIKWLKEEGAEVKRGDELVEIETDKANMTYEADAEGTLIEVVAGEGDTLPIGEVIARLGDPSEASQNGGGGAGEQSEDDEEPDDRADEGSEDGPESESEPSHAASGAEGGTQAESSGEDGGSATATAEREGGDEGQDGGGDGDGRIKASPVARRIAGERGVDLRSLEGSGPGGRIVKADVLAAADGDGAQASDGAEAEADGAEAAQAAEAEQEEQPAQAQPAARAEAGPKGEAQIEELTRLQQTIARRMAESKATAPDFALNVEVDMSECVALRARLKEVADPVPSYNDMIVKACAMTLREHPRANGAYRDGKFELYERVNVGVAVAAKNSLIVPTIFDADRKSLGEIAKDARGLIAKVRDGKITPPELSGGTFAVSNLGMYGIDSFSAVINPPQAAILAVGALKKKAVVDGDGRIVARDMMSMTLVCDHRILYGADAAEFFADVKKRLEQPLLFAI